MNQQAIQFVVHYRFLQTALENRFNLLQNFSGRTKYTI
ncbi:hypothetical protein NIES2104_66990 [Leptolyngbya sp. NIES-2104]|nr:hypothetical protein NIES2104_66990 [Leptolyngbya sp. NIES-2104]